MKKMIILVFILSMSGAFLLPVKAETEASKTQVEQVEQDVLFQGIEGEMGIPKELEISYENQKTGNKRTDFYPIKSKTVLKEMWTDDFSAEVIFYTYDAEYYELGEYKIPSRKETPGLEGYEGELLKQLGLSAENYQIEQVVWTGEPYTNEEGILCRDAVATGRKKRKDFLAVYGGTVEVLAEASKEESTDALEAEGETSASTGTDNEVKGDEIKDKE